MGGIMKLVSQADRGQYRTVSQVAEEVGRSVGRIKDAIRSGKVSGPTHKMPLGDGTKGAFVWLYTDSDVRRLKNHFQNVKWGRPYPEKDTHSV